jgi:SAM-dependent methyltransferase
MPDTNSRPPNIPRLSSVQTGPADEHYLVHRHLFAALTKSARFAQGKLLDIGCGNKPYEILFQGRITEYLGCDIVQSSLKKADFICPASQLPFADATFDTVLSSQTIEHLEDTGRFIAEAHRVLKSGGCFILSGPMYWNLHEEPHDYYRFTKYGFTQLLQQGRFTVLDILPNGGKWSVLGLVWIHTLPRGKNGRPWFMSWINRIFAYLDDRYPDYGNTSNYVVVAQKK